MNKIECCGEAMKYQVTEGVDSDHSYDYVDWLECVKCGKTKDVPPRAPVQEGE